MIGSHPRGGGLATTAALVVALLAVAPAGAAAQWVALEARGGAAVGNYTGTAAGLDLVPGPAAGVTVDVPLLPYASPYVSVNWLSFGCEEGFCLDRDVTVTSQGLGLGVRWEYGWTWLRTGLLYHGLTVEGADEPVSTGGEIGVELSGGVEIRVIRGLGVVPQIGFLRHGADTDGDGERAAILTGALGLRYTLGSPADAAHPAPPAPAPAQL